MPDFELKLISPDEQYYNGNVYMVVLPGEDGDFAAMSQHMPLITYLRPGKLDIIEREDQKKSFFVSGGFVKVEQKGCLVMVDYIKSIEQLSKIEIEKEIAFLEEKSENEEDKTLKGKFTYKISILREQLEYVQQ